MSSSNTAMSVVESTAAVEVEDSNNASIISTTSAPVAASENSTTTSYANDVTTTVDEAVAEAACSYSIDFSNFETAVKGLIDRAESAVELLAPRSAAAAESAVAADKGADSSDVGGVNVAPSSWSSSVKNLGDAMAAASVGAKGFRDMFSRFYKSNMSALISPLNFSTGEKVCDAFFRSVDRVVAPGGVGVSKFKGPVVYYSTTNPRFASVCLPIGEYYASAIQVYKKAPKTNVKKQLLPTLTLLDFYLAMYYALDGDTDAQESLIPNIYDLCDAAEAQAPGSGPGKRGGEGGVGFSYGGGGGAGGDLLGSLLGSVGGGGAAGAGGFGAMIGNIMSSMGMGGGGTGGENSVAGALGGITNIVKTLVERVAAEESMISAPRSSDGSIDPAAIVGCIGNVFQSPDIQRQIAETTKVARGAFGMNPTTNTTDTAPSAVELPPQQQTTPQP